MAQPACDLDYSGSSIAATKQLKASVVSVDRCLANLAQLSDMYYDKVGIFANANQTLCDEITTDLVDWVGVWKYEGDAGFLRDYPDAQTFAAEAFMCAGENFGKGRFRGNRTSTNTPGTLSYFEWENNYERTLNLITNDNVSTFSPTFPICSQNTPNDPQWHEEPGTASEYECSMRMLMKGNTFDSRKIYMASCQYTTCTE